ncbi:MAG TPA: polysaccharide deacetylase family protein [Micromonosporaceae bacterium]
MAAPSVAADTVLRVRETPLVLMYHAVAEVTEDPYHLAVPPERFARQMATLHRLGLRGVGVGDLLDAMAAGQARGLVGLTFDDGYAELPRHALPVLRRYRFGGTVFVVTERLGGSNDWDTGPVWPLLDADGIHRLAAEGIEIGSHGATHVPLAGLHPARLRDELLSSRDRLADLLGAPPPGFAYPYGSVDAAAREAVRHAGYRYACAVTVPRKALSPLTLPRSYAGARDGAARLTAKWALNRVRIAVKGGTL